MRLYREAACFALLSMIIFPAVLFADPSVELAEPPLIVRAQNTPIAFYGTGLGSATSITSSDARISFQNFSAGDTSIQVTVQAGQRAVAGPRDLTVHFSDAEDLLLENAIAILPGSPDLYALNPTSFERDGTYEASLQGINLDAVDAITAGSGIEVLEFEANPSDPTKGTVVMSVLPEAVAGARTVTLLQNESAVDLLTNAFTVTPGILELSDVDPASISRGDSSVVVTLTGANLDLVSTVNFGSGITVTSYNHVSPTTLEVTVNGLDAGLPVDTLRDVTLSVTGGGALTSVGVFTLASGELEVIRVRPNRGAREDTIEVVIDGYNLDDVTFADFGTGVSVDELTTLSPISVLATVTVAEDAPVGLHPVSLEGAFGENTLAD
ncbi:MAG: hypothetical protein KC561_13915, partial [Myxococcales bacterium]|nr:hypothetical protein [Myxococcales bacterium]